MTRFADLAVITNFSFLRGASHPEELVGQAHAIGHAGIGIADRNSLAGVVRAYSFVKERVPAEAGFRLGVGTRLVFADGTPDVLAYPRDRTAYGRLARLLTLGNRRTGKGKCELGLADLLDHADGLQMILTDRSTADAAPAASPDWPALVRLLRDAGPGPLWLATPHLYGPGMRERLAERAALARATGARLLATNDVTMHHPDRRALGDVLACIRLHTTLDAAGRRLAANAERHLKPADEMARIFAEVPDAVPESMRFIDGLSFCLSQLKYDYPYELRGGFATEQEALASLAAAGLADRYPLGAEPRIEGMLNDELALVGRLGYAAYFLTVHDIVRFARGEKILCQGRGSAANSVLCFALGITEVDPAKHDLLFERFISEDRNEPPDIDVDFEHDRREEVMQHIYARYGRERAGLAATVVTYRTRSAIREVGRAFGLSDDTVSALNGTVWGYWSNGVDPAETRRIGLDPSERRLALVLRLAEELAGFPRHLSQHTGGFVITRSRLDEVVPVGNAAMADRTTVEWDKDDLDALGILKIDVLGLGMLSALRGGFDLLERHYGERYTLASIPPEEPAVYDMICRADTIGVFQIESRAQMSMLPRLKPRAFYDLVVEVAIVRPGPIQGDMVHPYLRRREGSEPVVYPSAELEAVLGKTLGVPLFQEQAMRIAIVAGGFTPTEADKLRRAMATFKRVGTIGTLHDKMVEGMVERGYDRAFAERCFGQIEGFGTYGFPESHAASFALLVYASAWMKCRYPDVFACAMLNAQPMGFYAPAQLVRDARDHGVAVHEVDVNFSAWDHDLVPLGSGEDGTGTRLHRRHGSMRDDILGDRAIRLGLRQVKGLRQGDMERLVARRGGGYDSVRDLWLRAELSPAVLEVLAEADAFRSIGLERRDALWAVRGLDRVGDKDALPLFAREGAPDREPDADLPPLRLGEHVVEDYRRLTLSLKAHPVLFLRAGLARRRILSAAELDGVGDGRRAAVAGLVLVRQRPGSAHGTVFLTLEDETGSANVIVWPKVFEANRSAVIASRLLGVRGVVQRAAGVIHLVADRLEDLSADLNALGEGGPALTDLARADEVKRPQTYAAAARGKGAELGSVLGAKAGFPMAEDARRKAEPAQEPLPLAVGDVRRAMPKGRNFH
ncbi:DNA polymerase III subunit alpha [Lichenibacterium minor]|uniref:Error-prone DNA polymerase n=1 Tax=Lichenibacterium minor TaxID=2316528 RepID=A0A4V1RUM3_9HYPH|nr:error-prone DNA polymerase [Lichenibacterium minor]RYC31654.1 DNA polymerase III subunit alpha [Lichenibacterium minor]